MRAFLFFGWGYAGVTLQEDSLGFFVSTLGHIFGISVAGQ
jgi:hypothetical protein